MEELYSKLVRSALDLLLVPVRITYSVLDLPYRHLREDMIISGSQGQKLQASVYQQGGSSM
jgi:alpha-beta hydrolase superfamily lysophospholipase